LLPESISLPLGYKRSQVHFFAKRITHHSGSDDLLSEHGDELLVHLLDDDESLGIYAGLTVVDHA